jgi:IPT/TIG domain/PASTA domain
VKKHLAVSACLAVVAALAAPVSATGAQFVVGQTASTAQPPIDCTFEEPADEIQLGAATAPQYFLAAAGTITSWSTFAPAGLSQSFDFKVFRKVAPFTYLVVAQDRRTLTPGVVNTFSVAIPVQAGDFVGEGQPGGGVSTPCVFETGLDSDHILYAEGSDTPGGGTVVFPGRLESGYRLNVSATVLLPPTITAISPTAGSVKGVPVIISGTHFANVSGVSFGSTPAAGFTVESEEQITALAPPSTTLASVPVTVTTAAGTATSGQTFTYEGCVVPKLKGGRLKAAKKKIRKADCGVGRVKKRAGATARTGRVIKQIPKPSTVLPPGARVKIVLDD